MTRPPWVRPRTETSPLQVLGTEVRFLCEAEHTDGEFSMMEVTLPEGGGPPPHHHDWDEAYYLAEGVVRFTLGESTRVIHAGDFVYAPAGVVHGFAGASSTPARMLILDAPSHAAAFFREVDREVRAPEDLAKVGGIGARHGIHFLPFQG